jgi:hypothetical protein
MKVICSNIPSSNTKVVLHPPKHERTADRPCRPGTICLGEGKQEPDRESDECRGHGLVEQVKASERLYLE